MTQRDLSKDPQAGHLVGIENTPFPEYVHQEYPKVVKGADGLDYIVDSDAAERSVRDAERKAAEKKHKRDE